MIYIYIYVCVKIWFSHVNHISGWWFGFFSIIYGIILPIDFHIFQRGRSTTNQIYVKFIHIFSMNFSIYFNTCVDIPLIHIFFIYPWWTRPVRPSDIVRLVHFDFEQRGGRLKLLQSEEKSMRNSLDLSREICRLNEAHFPSITMNYVAFFGSTTLL